MISDKASKSDFVCVRVKRGEGVGGTKECVGEDAETKTVFQMRLNKKCNHLHYVKHVEQSPF